MRSQVTPYSSSFFSQIQEQAKLIQAQIRLIDDARQKRKKIYDGCIAQYQKYIKRQHELLDRNIKHCQARNDWFREQVNKSWRTAVSNRHLILRSVARTNVLKNEADEWLKRIEEYSGGSNLQDADERWSMRQSLQGSNLIDQYNKILLEYGHKI